MAGGGLAAAMVPIYITGLDRFPERERSDEAQNLVKES